MIELLDRFSGTSVLVVGDVMLDEYIWGEVRRVSPEAPVPVVEIRRRTYVPGGAANVASGVSSILLCSSLFFQALTASTADVWPADMFSPSKQAE